MAYEACLTESVTLPEPNMQTTGPIVEENLRSAQYVFNYQHTTKTYVLQCLHPVNVCQYFYHSAALNPYNYIAMLVL